MPTTPQRENQDSGDMTAWVQRGSSWSDLPSLCPRALAAMSPSMGGLEGSVQETNMS